MEGRVRGYDDRIWSENKEQILTDILMENFSQNKRLKKWLLSTKDAVLAENSTGITGRQEIPHRYRMGHLSRRIRQRNNATTSVEQLW